jgi:hypothetical protein
MVSFHQCRIMLWRLPMALEAITKELTRDVLTRMLPELDERQGRLLCASFASALGRGGTAFVMSVTGKARNTISSGIDELAGVPEAQQPQGSSEAQDEPADAQAGLTQAGTRRIRRKGGGRKSAAEKIPGLYQKIEEIVEKDGGTYGNPEKPLKWTTLSLRKIAGILCEQGIRISQNIVARALEALGYSRQQNQKMSQVGEPHPLRGRQFDFINETAGKFLNEGEPVISVDTKKKENLGNFKNGGSEWRRKGDPRRVLDHDFPLPELGKVAPYGIYVLNNNTGFVNLGLSHDTPEFAGESILQWWRHVGKATFPKASRLYITCDSGGSNGSRIWLWKYCVQRLADESGLEVWVSHFPAGASKWNKIEHRLFCYISKNWQGQPLLDVETVVNLIGSTTTEKGLTVRCEVDPRHYETGRKITEAEKDSINIEFISGIENWNYVIRPKL